ncbi:MAG: hypothetical protein M1538_00015 [Candidatus Marsarchaeota archaeon]|nr:hypothetical protein [Candidatus Marsarchaeota archaeon]
MTSIPEGYEYTWYRSIKCKLCGDWIPIFSLGHYKSKLEGSDEFSKKIMFVHLYGDNKFIPYFFERLCTTYKEWFEPDKFAFDYICVIPSHKKDQINANLKYLAEEFGKFINVNYTPLLLRNREVSEQHKINKIEERLENAKESISVNGNVKDKTILVLDNITTTGITIMVAHEALKQAGAKETIFIVLGLSSHFGIYNDFDLNPNLKFRARGIIEKFHSNKLSKEERDKHKSKINR